METLPLIRRLICAVVLFAAAGAPAADGGIAFAVPTEGRLTIGVFDSSGRMVRALHRLAPESDFQKGLNGLITRWDGSDDAGKKLPAGTYYLRGYVVGDVVVDGERFHFNDWVAAEDDPALTRIEDFFILSETELLVVAATADGKWTVARYSETDGFRWSHPLDVLPLAATDGKQFFLLGPDGLTVGNVETGEMSAAAVKISGAATLTANGAGLLFASQDRQLSSWTLPGLEAGHTVELPAAVEFADAWKSEFAGSGNGQLFLRRGAGAFAPVTVPAKVGPVSVGRDGTVWFVATEDQTAFVAQTSAGGELLRLLRPETGDPLPVRVRAARESEAFALLEQADGLQRLRFMGRDAGGNWVIEWERAIRATRAFGFVNGEPVADAPESKTGNEVLFRLEKNPLTGDQPMLRLHLQVDTTGSRIVTPDGLVLAEVSSRSDTQRGVIHRGPESDSLRVLLGNGAAVEEFSVRGLRHIQPLDVGAVEIP